uniref:Uncharacterized protein n=1 Tax=Panagrolaimus superbus TaxID=310955 RepID=A0A914Z424_9BILA
MGTRCSGRPAPGRPPGSALGGSADLQCGGIDAGHALDALGGGDRLVLLGLGGHGTAQADHAIHGFHLDFSARNVAAGQQVGLHLGGDPAVGHRSFESWRSAWVVG